MEEEEKLYIIRKNVRPKYKQNGATVRICVPEYAYEKLIKVAGQAGISLSKAAGILIDYAAKRVSIVDEE